MILLAKAQIIGGIVPNLIALSLFLGAIGYFALTGKMAEMFGWKDKKLSNIISIELKDLIIGRFNKILFKKQERCSNY